MASLNRKSKGRFWCVHQQVFPQFTTWLQDFVYATQDHLGCRNIDERLLHLFPVFIINVAIRPSNPCRRDTALRSAHRNSPYSMEIPAPRTSQHPASHSHQGSNTIPSSSGRWDFFPNQPAAVGDVLYPYLPHKSHQHRTPPLMSPSKASCRSRTGVSGRSSSLGSLELQEQPGEGLIKPSGGLSLNY